MEHLRGLLLTLKWPHKGFLFAEWGLFHSISKDGYCQSPLDLLPPLSKTTFLTVSYFNITLCLYFSGQFCWIKFFVVAVYQKWSSTMSLFRSFLTFKHKRRGPERGDELTPRWLIISGLTEIGHEAHPAVDTQMCEDPHTHAYIFLFSYLRFWNLLCLRIKYKILQGLNFLHHMFFTVIHASIQHVTKQFC